MSSTSTLKCPVVTHVSRQHFWRQHIEQWQAGDQSKMAYCRERALAYHQFIYWFKRLARNPSDTSTTRLVPVAVATPAGTAALRLSLPNGLRIEGIDASTVTLVGELIAQL